MLCTSAGYSRMVHGLGYSRVYCSVSCESLAVRRFEKAVRELQAEAGFSKHLELKINIDCAGLNIRINPGGLVYCTLLSNSTCARLGRDYYPVFYCTTTATTATAPALLEVNVNLHDRQLIRLSLRQV